MEIYGFEDGIGGLFNLSENVNSERRNVPNIVCCNQKLVEKTVVNIFETFYLELLL